MTNPIEWMTAYTNWNKEAQQELINLGYKSTERMKYSFAEDGTVFRTVDGTHGRNEFQSGAMKKKVTPWKESKHYIEL